MILSSLIRKRETENLATAIPAIPATQPKEGTAAVARIATVAVANPKEEKTASPAKVGSSDTATASRGWLIHYPGRDPVEVACCSEASHADILGWHRDAIAAEPFTPIIQHPSAPLTNDEEKAIRAWLALIEEIDSANIADVVYKCQQDADARAYFVERAKAEVPTAAPHPDDRRACQECANLIGRRCTAAARGDIVATRNYEPVTGILRRCDGYMPGVSDRDRRPGKERWPVSAIKNSQED